MSREFVIANIQLNSVDQVEKNLSQIEGLIEEIFSREKPRLICLPENCLYLRIVEGEKIEGMEVTHPALTRLAHLALQKNTYLHLGSVPLKIEGKLFNSSILISPRGDILPTYRKIHLFDIQLDNQMPIRESDVFTHGAGPSIIEIDGWRFGESICYDLRFAELYSFYAKNEVDVILVPSAFLVKTGEAHWHTLLRARAIESQAYVIASAQGGTHVARDQQKRETFGHSIIVDPWGMVLGEISELKEGYFIFKLSRSRIEQVRKQIPMKSHRRLLTS